MKPRNKHFRILPITCRTDGHPTILPRLTSTLGIIFYAVAFFAATTLAADTPGNAPVPTGPVVQENLEQSIQDVVTAEKSALKELKQELTHLKKTKDEWASSINAFRMQIATYQSIPISSTTKTKDLDWGWNNIRASKENVTDHITKAAKAFDLNHQELLANRQNISLNKEQLKKLQQSKPLKEVEKELAKPLKSLINVLTEKEKIRNEIQAIYSDHIAEFRDLEQQLNRLAVQFEKQLDVKKKENLFLRRESTLSTIGKDKFIAESRRILTDLRKFFTPNYWRQESAELWQSAGYSLISYSILFLLCAVLLIRGRLRLKVFQDHPFCQQHPVHGFFFTLLDRLLLPAGITFFAYLFTQINAIYFSSPSLSLIVYIMMLWVMAGCGRDFIRLWHRWQTRAMPDTVNEKAMAFFTAIRWSGSAYLLAMWGMGEDAIWLTLLRIFFEMWLVIWLARLWKLARNSIDDKNRNDSPITVVFISVIFGVAFVGLFIELSGFGYFASYWYLSWGRTIFVTLWWSLFFRMLREWDLKYHDKLAETDDGQMVSPVKWISIRFGQFICLLTFIIFLILAWGGKQAVLANLYSTLGHPLQIGNMKFSILGIFYAGIVLLLTQAVARLWRFLFHTKFLAQSGLMPGVQDSITTLTTYVVWIFGILISLHVFGLNTASLAVAFGALGIGLGFGLQNIFNNFISGIILLFERPIQVGDDVEINGVWARVRKINVRSTVVQTYDNASLIIPNSEFVSSQVTNWSFKDRRVRRKIVVGVAYGSDITLVRNTLFEVAEKNPQILRHPAPDVLFSDFGDSALVFTLRVWATVENFLQMESNVRFEIDRLFRERNIEISFPQRDLHLRTMPANLFARDTESHDKPQE